MLIREMKAEEAGILKDFLYEAIFIPEGVEPPDRSIVELPELRSTSTAITTEEASGSFCTKSLRRF